MTLPPLPAQPEGIDWPVDQWPVGAADGDVDLARLDLLLAHAFSSDGRDELGETKAVLAAHRGRLVVERYGRATTPTTTLPSWSVAKSVLAAAVGTLVAAGRLDLDEPVGRPEWAPGDPRHATTVGDLLRMRDGTAWNEAYVDDGESDVVGMLYGEGRGDVAAFAAGRPAECRPGERWCYSSGTSNVLAWVVGRALGGPEAVAEHLDRTVFQPVGMRSATPKFDRAGTWIGSTYCFATARDFLRFGSLHLRGGVAGGVEVLPRAWVETCRTPQPDVDDEGWGYGAHWWTRPELGGCFAARGYQGQLVLVAPAHDLVLVRLGESPEEVKARALAFSLDVAACFASA